MVEERRGFQKKKKYPRLQKNKRLFFVWETPGKK